MKQKPLWENSADMKRKRVLRNKLNTLVLNNENVWIRENQRPKVEASPGLFAVYYSLCAFLDIVYKDRPIQRFWFLEKVARMPYFSYVAVLHLYETLGWWSVDSSLRRIHNEEEYNECNHLLIMESLGGNSRWTDRFLASHAAILYYLALVVLFLVSPKTAYNSSELLEMHAVDTYTEFKEANKDILSELPPPLAALEYYNSKQAITDDLLIIRSLYDVFDAIANDELTHAKSMNLLQNSND